MGSLSRQRGVSLIEVLVAVVIFSIGVLGVALMQLKSAQFTKQAGSRTVAVVQARSLADAMRANPAGVYGVANQSLIPAQNGVLTSSYYVYNGASAPDPSTCSGANVPCQQAKRDLLTWLAQLKASTVAPTSGGEHCCSSFGPGEYQYWHANYPVELERFNTKYKRSHHE